MECWKWETNLFFTVLLIKHNECNLNFRVFQGKKQYVDKQNSDWLNNFWIMWWTAHIYPSLKINLIFIWISNISEHKSSKFKMSFRLKNNWILTWWSLKYRPQALQTGSPLSFLLHKVVVFVLQFAHDKPVRRFALWNVGNSYQNYIDLLDNWLIYKILSSLIKIVNANVNTYTRIFVIVLRTKQ